VALRYLKADKSLNFSPDLTLIITYGYSHFHGVLFLISGRSPTSVLRCALNVLCTDVTSVYIDKLLSKDKVSISPKFIIVNVGSIEFLGVMACKQ
jgi:hypothetical protein